MIELNQINKIIKNNVLIEALYVEGGEVPKWASEIIRPATPSRGWLNEKGQEYAYHCLPLSHASSLGYWILTNSDVEIYWDGFREANRPNFLENVKITETNKIYDNKYKMAGSHFQKGIVSFSFPFLFKTPPGWGLYVGPCPNYPIDGLQGLEAIVETNWLPFTFSMNFKITKMNYIIKIPQKTPICRVYPFPLNLNEKTKCEIKSIDEYPDFAKAYNSYNTSRGIWNKNLAAGKLKIEHPNDSRQMFYKNGTNEKKQIISEGFHKLDYRYSLILNKNSTSAKKCPFLSYVSKFKNIFNSNK